jgi:sugar phosphate isomerase/epimerase
MASTRTGGFPIGFRRGNSDWQRDLTALVSWASGAGFVAIDLGPDGDQGLPAVRAGGLRVGSVDLPDWRGMIAADAAGRAQAVERNAAYVRACGAVNHFAVMVPADPAAKRADNFGWMIESLTVLAPVLEEQGACLAIEGWPGPGALCCTPEGYRALFERLGSPAIGINYDPSHLIRAFIDPLRFLREFAGRVHHVHAKDTLVDSERLYEFGVTQPATFARSPAFGSTYWRYTIPGHGSMPWSNAFSELASAGYEGCVSVELEDAGFTGSTEAEQLGLTLSLGYLEGA